MSCLKMEKNIGGKEDELHRGERRMNYNPLCAVLTHKAASDRKFSLFVLCMNA